MHKNGTCLSRGEIVKQVIENEPSVSDYASYVPVGDASAKLTAWKDQGAEIIYLTSRKKPGEISDIRNVLQKFNFPKSQLFFRKENESYAQVAETIMPNILIEDDCESIGGVDEMTYTHLTHEAKEKIKLITIKEFGGIDYLPNEIDKLVENKI